MDTRKVVLGILVIAVVGAGISAYRYFKVCAPASAAAFAEPAPFGGASLDADPNILDSPDVCVGSTSTTAPADDVIAHYERELTRLGWAVRIDSEQEIAARSGCHGDDGGDQHCPTHTGLTATRDGLCYGVGTEQYPGTIPPGSKQVSVVVRDC